MAVSGWCSLHTNGLGGTSHAGQARRTGESCRVDCEGVETCEAGGYLSG